MNSKIIHFAAAIVMSLYSAPAFAQASEGDRTLGEQFNFELRGQYWMPTLSNTVRSDAGALTGTEIDLVSDLGLDSSKGLPVAEVIIKFADRHKIRFDYTSFTYSGDKAVSKEIIFNGITYPVSSQVKTNLELRDMKLSYEYDIFRDTGGYIAFRLAADYVYANASIVASGVLSNSASVSATAPVVGLSGRLCATDWLSFTADIAGVGYDKSTVYDASLYFDINPMPNVGLTVGYRTIRINVDIEDKKADTQWNGAFAGLAVRF
ncbi:MAG: hypothetical protein HY751_11260 [Nitrospinae bacterium]|nr:hypothetical protein [Nitrospinota bacterium]